MHSNELPEMLISRKTNDLRILTQMLARVLEGSAFTHYLFTGIIHGTKSSGRVLSPRPYLDCVALPAAFSPEQIAQQLLLFSNTEARYDPPQKLNGIKGWSIQKIKGLPIAVAHAIWIE